MSERFDKAVMEISREVLDGLLVQYPRADEATTMAMLAGVMAREFIDIIAGRRPSPVALETIQDFRDFADSAATFFRAASATDGLSERWASIAQALGIGDDEGIH